MRHLPFVIAASLLFCAPAASGLRADPPPAPVPVVAPEAKEPDVAVVNISTRLVEATARAARSLRRLGAARTSGEATTYDPAALACRLECWERAGHVTTLSAPRLTVYQGQNATITVGEQVSFIQDYELESGSSIADPVIGTLFEGLRLDCVATLAPGGVTLAADLTLADLKRPIQELETLLAGTKVRIQLPEVHIRKLVRRVHLLPGRAALLGELPALPSEPCGRSVLVWIEAHAVNVPAALGEMEKKVAEALR